MTGSLGKITAAAVAVALCTASTGAMAASPATGAASVSPWLALSAMSASSTASAASLAAAQDYDDDERSGLPPLAVLAVILGTLALGIYILIKDDDDDLDFRTPISPN